ncbi:NUDIX domain-containing protein [Candidatus Pacearchaeota archaeon]|nr:NUDIX domain-containing protein [Candidatus Pacearchaeota archaeon]
MSQKTSNQESRLSPYSGISDATVEVIKKQVKHDGFFRLEEYHLRHRLFCGEMSDVFTRELFERGHAAALLPYDPVQDRVVFIEQFRIGALEATEGAWLLEFVAGVIDEGETADQVVRRESTEEAGCEILALEQICRYFVSPGGTSETVELFCGKVDATGVNGIHGLSEEHEDIRVFSVPYDEAVQMLNQGHINSAIPIMAMQWLMMNRERLRELWK